MMLVVNVVVMAQAVLTVLEFQMVMLM